MLIIGLVCSLWQVLVNDLKGSPGGPRYDCTNCCYVTRGSIMRDQGERGSRQRSWTLDCLLCHRKVQGGLTYIYVPENMTMTERSRAGKLLDVLGRIIWNNSWRVVFNKHGRCKLRYKVYTGCCIGYGRLSPVGYSVQLGNLLCIFTAPSCYCCLVFCCLFFTSVFPLPLSFVLSFA